MRRYLIPVASMLVAALAFGSCETVVGYRWVDPPGIDYGDDGKGELIGPGPPSVEIGFYIEQLYEPLADGADMWVVHGLQGGTWTMPALRTTGIGPLSEVTCSMVTDTGEQVSRVASETRFFLATDGLLEVQAYPIPVQHASPNERLEIDDLYGLDAILECTVIDGKGRGASVTLEVVLARG